MLPSAARLTMLRDSFIQASIGKQECKIAGYAKAFLGGEPE
jgi:hypothetical protein